MEVVEIKGRWFVRSVAASQERYNRGGMGGNLGWESVVAGQLRGYGSGSLRQSRKLKTATSRGEEAF